MRNLTGYLKKILLAISLLFSLFLLLPDKILAQESPFNITSSFVHKVDGRTVNTELTIHLDPGETTKVLSLYTTSIQAQNIKASCFHRDGSSIKCESYNRVSTTDVQMDLKNTVVSPGTPLQIKIVYSYELQNEITYSFPSKVLDSKTAEVRILYPKDRGDFTWSSENISSKDQKGDFREVIIKDPVKDSISIFFDSVIQYSFSISRQFNNSSDELAQTFELIVPLDDSTQVVVWENIDPLPTSAVQDEDGNYIFKYLVQKGESISVKLSGYILKEKSHIESESLQAHLQTPSGLWELRDTTETKRIATFMKEKGLNINQMMNNIDGLKDTERDLFYKFLYQYIIYRLDYKKETPLGIENTPRIGIAEILKNSLDSTPVDYADFYMSLLRNYSIPSRMVVGYISNVTGYTADGFYHYWIEYFDTNKKEWIPVDPFLEEYFGHNLFGTQLNDHIVVLKRGKSPMAPTLTFYAPTDFIVQMSNKEGVKMDMTVNSNLSFDEYDVTKQYAKAYITSSNTGNVIVSKINLLQSNIGDIKKYIDSVNNSSSLILLPKQTSNIQLNIPTEQMFFKQVSISTQFVNNAGYSKDLTISDQIPENIPFYTRVLSKILSLVSFGILLLLFYTIYKLIQKRRWIQQ